MSTSVPVLNAINPKSAARVVHSFSYDGTKRSLAVAVKAACDEFHVRVTEDIIATIVDYLLSYGACWIEDTYCLETLSMSLGLDFQLTFSRIWL